jgi:hypothetical protein
MPPINPQFTTFETRGFIGGIMVSVLVSKAVHHGLIGGIMVSMLVSKAVDRGFIGGRIAFLSR